MLLAKCIYILLNANLYINYNYKIMYRNKMNNNIYNFNQ